MPPSLKRRSRVNSAVVKERPPSFGGGLKLRDRIELREQPGEELSDEGAFDLAWIPAPFVPPHALGRLVEQVHRSLKPGGWLLFAAARSGEDLRGAALRFRVALYGGAPSSQEDIEKLLADKGLTDVRTLPGPPRDFKIIVAGRRARI